MEPTCSSPTTRGDLSAAMTRANNMDWNFSTADYMLSRPADFRVYIFNIAKQEYKISRLPLIKELVIPARKEGEKYALVTSLPSPFKFPKGNVDSNDIDIVIIDGRRMAMDIIRSALSWPSPFAQFPSCLSLSFGSAAGRYCQTLSWSRKVRCFETGN